MKKLIKICKYPLKFNYYVTDDGRVWSEKSHKYMATREDRNGYLKVVLVSSETPEGKRHRYSVHRLVLENFCPIENMENFQVNHKDGDKTNNKLENLEWVTCQENINHAIKNNLRAKVNGSAKLTKSKVFEIIELLLSKKYTNVEIARRYNVNEETIGRIKRKQSWKDLTQNIDFE
jgi:hypothetical protein